MYLGNLRGDKRATKRLQSACVTQPVACYLGKVKVASSNLATGFQEIVIFLKFLSISDSFRIFPIFSGRKYLP